ncbi:MAG: hypothetical protein KA444_06730 [Bacteroidia bacterium]|nr:hypothetical protein [Bacteroidia bacterium]
MEGDLSKELDLEVRNYLRSNPSAQADFEILKRTKIHPEFSNKLIDKTSLYKGGKVLQFNTRLFRISAIAASLVILLLSYTIIIRFQKENSLADIEIDGSEKSEINLPLTSEGSKEQQMKPEKKLITSVEDRKDNTPSQRKTHKQENLVVPEVAFTQGEKVVEDQSRALPDIEPVAIESGKNVVLPIETKIETLITLPANEPLAHTDEELEKVFSKEELVALGVLTAEKIDSETSNLWKLADSGVDRLAKATGTNMDIAKADTDSESSTTFALGKFSFTRSRMR